MEASSSLPAGWPTPNYVDPERRTWLPAFMLTWQIISTVLISGRFYLRARKQAGSIGLDDLLVFLGWLLSVGVTATVWIDVVHFGLDRHVWDMKLEWAVGAALTGWISQVLFIASTVCTKLSVLLFHRRMINLSLSTTWLWIIRGALIFTTCYGIGVPIAYFLVCQPLEALWMKYDVKYIMSGTKYKCRDASSVAITAGILSVISDTMAVVIPCWMLNTYALNNIPRRQKWALNATFALGLLATGAGIARSYYLWKIQHSTDTTWMGYDLFAWSIVECHLAIICACAPSLRVFFRKYLIDTLRRTLSSVSHYANGSGEEKEATTITLTTVTRTNRDSRGFCELKELESGVHGLKIPKPVILQDDTRYTREDDMMRHNVTAPLTDGERSQPTTPKITNAEEYESYAIGRLSRHGTICKEKSLTRLNNSEQRHDSDETL